MNFQIPSFKGTVCISVDWVIQTQEIESGSVCILFFIHCWTKICRRGIFTVMTAEEQVQISKVKGATVKMWLGLSISGHTWVMESLEPRVNLFESFSSFNALTLGSRDSITQVWPEIETLSDVVAVTPFIFWYCNSGKKPSFFSSN